MHELAVTESILEIALRHGRAAGATAITDLFLVVGELSTIVDESVQFYWDIVSEGTEAAGATLHFRRVPARLLGVSLSGLTEADGEAQLTLFDEGSPMLESDKDRRLSRAIDAVRSRFGRDAVLPGRVTGRTSRPR